MLMSREELIEKVKKSSPCLGWDYDYPYLFGKYGRTIAGICVGWEWFNSLEEATNEELLEMLAMSNGYWSEKYEKWNEEQKEKCQELDSFIGICEREFFGYGKEYNLQQIDKILNSALIVLRRYFDKIGDCRNQ